MGKRKDTLSLPYTNISQLPFIFFFSTDYENKVYFFFKKNTVFFFYIYLHYGLVKIKVSNLIFKNVGSFLQVCDQTPPTSPVLQIKANTNRRTSTKIAKIN